MNSLLYLLLELQQAQLALSKAQASHASRYTLSRPYTGPVQNVTTAASPAPITAQPVQQTAQLAPVTIQQAPAPSTVPAQTSGDFRSQVEAYVLADTNQQRAQNGLPALMPDAQVAAVARAHSDDMLANNYFEHNALNGCDPGCRLTNAGYAWMSYGENIHWMSGYNLSAADTAQKIVTDWMNSPGHRANILGSFKYAGIGISISGTKIDTTADYTTK